MIVDEVLRGLPDDVMLGDSDLPWILNLMEGINNALTANNVNLEYLNQDSTGKELQEALRALPANTQISLLNDHIVSFGRRRRRQSDVEKQEKAQLEIMEKKLKYNIIKYGALVCAFLVVVFVSSLVVLSFKLNATPDAQIASSLFTTVVEIMKLVFSVN